MVQSRRSSTKNWIKHGLLGATAVGIAALIVVSALPQPIPVDVAQATRGELEITVDESGRTRVKDRHVVSTPLTATLARIDLDPGDPVEAGQVVARLMPLVPPLLDERTRAQADARVAASLASKRQAQASVERAQAARDFAIEEHQRQQNLTHQGAAASSALERASLEERTRRAELTSARFASRVADSELEMARAARGRLQRGENDEQLEVPSPVDGVVLRVLQESEGVVQTGAPLLEVGNPAALEIVVDVLTADAVAIESGSTAKLAAWGGGTTLEGHVRRVEPSAFTEISALGVEEQRVNVVIDIDSAREAWESLGDGFRVEAKILIWRTDDVLRIPSSALFRSSGSWSVFTVEEETAQLTEVAVGRDNGLLAEIRSGIEEGDSVIVHPSDQIVAGITVTPR